MSLESIDSAKLDEYEKSLPRTGYEHAASLEPLTVVEFEKYNERNEKALRAEFRKVDTEFGKVDTEFGKVHTEFGRLHSRIDSEIDSVKIMMHDGFSKVDRKFAAVDVKFIEVDTRFDEVDARFDKVDARFDKVENRLDKLQHELRMMNARAQNQTLSRLHQSIKVVTVLDESSGKELYPSKEVFPAQVKDFWNLQKNCMSSNHPQYRK